MKTATHLDARPFLFALILVFVLLFTLGAKTADPFVATTNVQFENTLGAPLFNSAVSKVAIEKMDDGTYMVYWPVEADSAGPRVAMMRVEANWKTLSTVTHTVLHGNPEVFYDNKPLEQLPKHTP